jgi:hypothetical protein
VRWAAVCSDPVSYHQQLLLHWLGGRGMDRRSTGRMSVEYINRKPTSQDRSRTQTLAIMAGQDLGAAFGNPAGSGLDAAWGPA